MTKLIWMSDLHFAADGVVLGHDPRVRLKAAIDYINAHHSDAEACIISGDMVNRGAAADYAALAGHLADLKIPMFPMVGNHDDRGLLRARFDLPQAVMSDFVQYAVPLGDALAICLDTQTSGADAGEFCDQRLRWLRDVLEVAAGPVYLFAHHPPVALGLPMQDTDRMLDADPFLDLISASSRVKYLFIGHVHRPITGTIRGIPFATMRSVLYQAPPPDPAWDWDSFTPAKEAPALGVIRIADGDVQLHYDQFCDYSVGT